MNVKVPFWLCRATGDLRCCVCGAGKNGLPQLGLVFHNSLGFTIWASWARVSNGIGSEAFLVMFVTVYGHLES